MNVIALQEFNRIWDACASLGFADDRGGAQYQRVLREWNAMRFPLPIAQFVLTRADIDSEGKNVAEWVVADRVSRVYRALNRLGW